MNYNLTINSTTPFQAMSKIHEFQVAMTCEGCSGAVERVLSKVKDGSIQNVDISLEKQRVKVLSSMSSEQLLEILKKTGKSVEYLSSNAP